jgi:DNA-binding MarR family transcriptional regulator
MEEHGQIITHRWMYLPEGLGLKTSSAECVVYALIYGVSAYGGGMSIRSQHEIARWLDLDVRTVNRTVLSLLDKGLINEVLHERISPKDKALRTKVKYLVVSQDKANEAMLRCQKASELKLDVIIISDVENEKIDANVQNEDKTAGQPTMDKMSIVNPSTMDKMSIVSPADYGQNVPTMDKMSLVPPVENSDFDTSIQKYNNFKENFIKVIPIEKDDLFLSKGSSSFSLGTPLFYNPIPSLFYSKGFLIDDIKIDNVGIDVVGIDVPSLADESDFDSTSQSTYSSQSAQPSAERASAGSLAKLADGKNNQNEEEIEKGFSKLIAAYPQSRRGNLADAHEAYLDSIKAGYIVDTILGFTKDYLDDCAKQNGSITRYIKILTNWLSANDGLRARKPPAAAIPAQPVQIEVDPGDGDKEYRKLKKQSAMLWAKLGRYSLQQQDEKLLSEIRTDAEACSEELRQYAVDHGYSLAAT